MFGLFGSKKNTQAVYDKLLNYLTDDWHMKDRYARAFLDEYHYSVAKWYKYMLAHLQGSLSLLSVGSGGRDYLLTLTLVALAYQGYMYDLRRGKHVDTNIELAIWAILSNRSDLVENFDKGVSNYIREMHDKRFHNY